MPLALGMFGVLVILESRRPLRPSVESKTIRTCRNLLVAGTAAVAIYIIERPVAKQALDLVERRHLGLLKLIPLPRQIEALAAVILLDYTLYLWHVLTHRVPILWRFHVVHHTDRDLDASTAIRFHFGEMIISVAWRAAQIIVLGVSPRAFRTWQTLLFPSIFFHHSNIELPKQVEHILSKVIVTPRMHGIHHSTVQRETDSNWSSGLAIWDLLHGTFRSISGHDEVKIGVPAFQNEADVTVGKLLALPFLKQPPSWTNTELQRDE